MRNQPDRDQNDKLGNDYFDTFIRPPEEPKIEQEDLQNEILKAEDSPWVKAATRLVGVVFVICIILLMVAVVIGGFKLALGL